MLKLQHLFITYPITSESQRPLQHLFITHSNTFLKARQGVHKNIYIGLVKGNLAKHLERQEIIFLHTK